jgi:hypothetical protein
MSGERVPYCNKSSASGGASKAFCGSASEGILNMSDYRWCEKCMMRTEHEAVVDTRDYNPRGRGMYRCKRCGRVKSMRHLRPSSEIGY